MKKKDLITAVETLAFAVDQLANIEPEPFDILNLNCRYTAKLCVKEICEDLNLPFSPELETIEIQKARYYES